MAGLPVHCGMVSIVVLRTAAGHTQMLVVRRAGPYLNGAWSYVAGHVAADESGWQTALRELREETGLVPGELYATSFCEQFYSAQADCVEIVPAFVARVAADAVVHLNPEHSACRWVSLEEAARMLPFGSQRGLLGYVEREFLAREPSAFLRIAIQRPDKPVR